jgi:poly-beta-1,6-N-acetyl-D-glucosamine N-deacetylase
MALRQSFRRARTTAAVLALTLAAVAMPLLPVPAAVAADSAVILVYQRFDDPDWPYANIRMEQFEEHVAELKNPRYHVLPVPEIVDKLRKRMPLPDRTIGITIDDADISVYSKAWPVLRAAKLPFTLFISTEPVDLAARSYMTWDQIRELKRAGVTIGSLGKSYPHLPELSRGAVKLQIEEASDRFRAELGEAPTLFAYPFGEWNPVIRALLAERGFTAAFGQNSGVLHGATDPYTYARFHLTERFAGIDRFRLIADALPLPVTDLIPADPVIEQNPPALGFTVAPEVGDLDSLACFAAGEGRVHLEQLERRVEVRLPNPFPPGRVRINCTMPGPEERWRWLGVQLTVPQ